MYMKWRKPPTQGCLFSLFQNYKYYFVKFVIFFPQKISITGPLSGIFRILDSPRAMKRIQDMEKGPREKKVEQKPPTPVAPVQVKTTTPAQPVRRPPAARQQSEDDEIARIKRENKAAGSSTTPAATETPAARKTPSTEEPAAEVSQVL